MTTRIPFTESQWEELENQALVFKNLAANIPVPPHLLFLIRRLPFLFSASAYSSSSNFFSPHFGCNVYEIGMGRKIDAEPGRVKSKRSCSGLAMEADDGSSKYESLKQREKQPDRSCFILGTELGTLERPLMLEEKQKQRDDKDYEEDEQQSKRFYKFLDEWPSSKSSGSTSLFI
ncbi:unnamed protein product [Brassica oleracea]